MDIIDENREEFGPKLQEFAALRGKSDRLLGGRYLDHQIYRVER